MTQIDWSKAPADATHYHPQAGGYAEHWIKPGHFCVVGFEAQGWNSDWAKPAMGLAVPRPVEPAEWNGEGLPPTGIEVEIKLKSTRADWCRAMVLFCQDDALVIAWKAEGVARPTTLSAVDIRPIRTPDEVEQALEVLPGEVRCKAVVNRAVRLLIDAGYRKP